MNALVNGVLLTEVFVTLFVIMDPVGTVPIFLSLTSGRSASSARRAAWQAVTVSFGVISAFGFFGQQILAYLNISLPALQGAGGLEGGQRDVQVAQDLLAEEREGDDHRERDRYRLPRGTMQGRRGAAPVQRQEDRDGADRVHDHEQRDEDLGNQHPLHGSPP